MCKLPTFSSLLLYISPLPPSQGAYGILCEVESHPFEGDKMLFMDWRDDHTFDEPEMRAANARLPTFLYAMPMGPNRLFLEETSLVARPAVPFDELKERLYKRLHHYGVKVTGVIEEEFCLIPMGGVLPKNPQRVIGVGGTGGHVHPSTGYMVARTVGVAPVIADAIVEALHGPSDRATDRATPRRPRSEEEAYEMAAEVWRASWPKERLWQREFFNFGMDVLLQLDIAQTRQFFKAFFNLSPFHWQGFLSSR
jgi:lycopene beta-cyclase